MKEIPLKEIKSVLVERDEIERVLEKLGELAGKYFDLVWYARSDPDCYADDPDMSDSLRAQVFMAQAGVEANYPEEVKDLNSQEITNWTHGFNSGMLAAIRLVRTALDGSEFGGMELALDEFPFLDT